MSSEIVLVAITALGFGAWPLIGRASGANQAWVTTIVMVISTVVIALAHTSRFSDIPTRNALLALTFAGLFNGVSMVTYGRLLMGTQFSLSIVIPTILLLMTLITVVGGIAFFDEQLTTSKTIGILFAGIATWLLSR